MSLKYNPKKLEEIALVVMHNDIIDNLEFAVKQPKCHDLSLRTESWMESICYSCNITSNLYNCSIDDVVSVIRSNLSRTLVGIVNDDIRKKLLLCFNKDTAPPLTRRIEFMANNKEFVDFLYAYLDCVLDESITELKVPNNLPVTFLHGNNSSNLFEIIAKRSPFLKEIELNFKASYMSRMMSNFSPESPKIFISSLQLLKNLTSLSISYIHPEYRSFFQYVGSSFPSLNSLTVSEFPVTAGDIMAIIGGHDLVTLLRAANHLADRLHQFQLDPQCVTPICTTLQHLRLGGGNLSLDVPVPAIAFLLRHMPHLKTCVINPGSSNTMLATELLHHNSNPPNPSSPDPRAEDFSTILKRDAPFSGRLSLTDLDYVPVDDEGKLKAVQFLCPQLEKITFCQSSTLSTSTTTSTNMAPINDNLITSHQLQAILNQWSPNLKKVSFNDVPADFRQIILNQFCNDLTELSYESVYNINPLELSSCTKLKSLEILERTSLMNGQSNDKDEFLPRLKKLKTNVCLGSMSQLFQTKSSYTFLDIACCHVASEESEWMRIAQIWPHVQTLRIRRTKGLNRMLARKVFPKFRKLKELALSESMVGGDINLKEMLMADKVINLLFLQGQSYMYCPLFGEKAEWGFDIY